MWCSVLAWYSDAIASSRDSVQARPVNWRDVGMPRSPRPFGTAMAGSPARLPGAPIGADVVGRDDRSSVRVKSGETLPVVGPTIASYSAVMRSYA